MDIHIYQHADPAMLSVLNQILGAITKMGLDFTAANAALAAETSAVTATSALISTLSAQLTAAAANVQNPQDQATLNALAASWQAQNTALSASVVANTPAQAPAPASPAAPVATS